ncbi:NLRC3-like protein [Labeo rohita]|uniref:NLRC3-like protein n=1 Tax=Labeo rohita TaxID=84645 RepID=A0A498N5I6_LABRO|nr:NLRC3-like protein [Labeo rohita]
MDDDAVDMASDNSLPLGIGASAFGSENGDEEDDVIPQRTLPFALEYSGPVGVQLYRRDSSASSSEEFNSDDEDMNMEANAEERYPERFRDPLDGLDLVDLVDKMLELCDIEVSLKITLALFNIMNFKKLVEYLQGLCKRNEVRYELKLTLKRKYEMRQFQSLPPSAKLPVTLTNLYTFMLHGHTIMSIEKLKTDPTEETKDLTADQLLIKLAKLSYNMLEKNEFQMEKEHWDDVALPDSYPAMACTGLCTEYYREKYMIYTEKVSCFAHPTIQEYLAALHVFYCHKKQGKNVLEQGKLSKVLKVSLTDLLRSAVDKALSSKNSNYDLFLRFLLGLSVEANQDLLKNILQIPTSSSQNAREEITRYISKKLKEGHFPEKTENLLRCIDELNPQ